MANPVYDALIIGGGPGGSTVATFLARAGKRVLLLEKEHFPRFHIGESLLPYNRPIFEELGVLPALEAAGFLKKWGAQFHLGHGSKSLSLAFRNGRFTREPWAYQVERARFDHILLEHARATGAEVREGWTVGPTFSDHNLARVEATGPGGNQQTFSGSFLIDATGRSNLTANQQGLRRIHPRHKKLAIFAHFSGVELDSGERAGDTVIIRLSNQWFWLIPLTPDRVSVGCVMDQEEFARMAEPPAEIFDFFWRSSPPLRQRLSQAKMLTPVQVASDFSYTNRRLVGPRLLRVGDAAGFMDPIFSAGVFLAMHSGKLASKVVLESLAANDDGQRRLPAYEREVFRAMELYWRLVQGFYTQPFLEVFLEPRHRLDLPAALTAVLAGELNAGFMVRWRLFLFFAIVKLQRRWPLLPRISFPER